MLLPDKGLHSPPSHIETETGENTGSWNWGNRLWVKGLTAQEWIHFWINEKVRSGSVCQEPQSWEGKDRLK